MCRTLLYSRFISFKSKLTQQILQRLNLRYISYIHDNVIPMLRLLAFKEQGRKDFWKSSKPCHFGIHRIAPSHEMGTQMSNEYPSGRVSVIFNFFLHHFVLVKLATSSIRVNSRSHPSRPHNHWHRRTVYCVHSIFPRYPQGYLWNMVKTWSEGYPWVGN